MCGVTFDILGLYSFDSFIIKHNFHIYNGNNYKHNTDICNTDISIHAPTYVHIDRINLILYSYVKACELLRIGFLYFPYSLVFKKKHKIARSKCFRGKLFISLINPHVRPFCGHFISFIQESHLIISIIFMLINLHCLTLEWSILLYILVNN